MCTVWLFISSFTISNNGPYGGLIARKHILGLSKKVLVGARGRENCCIFHQFSSTDSIKTEFAVFLYYKFSLFLKDRFFQVI